MTARVLVVDDQHSGRQLLTRATTRLGHEVLTAEDGAAALAVLRRPGPAIDVVLLDLVMPVMDGEETLRRIKDDERLRHLPVLVVSAVDAMARILRCIELGATDFLPKPFDRELLAARLRASLVDKRARDLELDHLEQVGRVITAAVAIESGSYETPGLAEVAARDDALGLLATTVERMARQVRSREEALEAQVRRLRSALDREQLDERVAEVTGTAYYRRLTHEAADLKRLLRGEGTHAREEGRDG
jgi:two-component system, cell cycle response regulator